jgi:hypothetical protein
MVKKGFLAFDSSVRPIKRKANRKRKLTPDADPRVLATWRSSVFFLLFVAVCAPGTHLCLYPQKQFAESSGGNRILGVIGPNEPNDRQTNEGD